MDLQTKIPIVSQEPKINYTSEMLLLGSCFAENIGDKFGYYKFKTTINPFGILFHPKAIETFLWMATQREEYTATDLFYYNERWHCFDAHSILSDSDQNKILKTLNDSLVATYEKLKTATHVFITLGTAWVYRLKAMDMIVANCHKIPQREFKKELLSITEVSQCLQNSVNLIRSINPKAQVVFTISPVRHSKDGFVENNRSKAHLITALHQVIEGDKNLSYFPAYEIMMDELRDYRFYKRDMIHPSEIAVDYIWEKCIAAWVATDALQTMKTIAAIQKGINHKPFQSDSKQHQAFLNKLESTMKTLQGKYPHISWHTS